MAVIHNARHNFNNGVTNIPSTSVLSALDAMDPREWKIFFEDFSVFHPATDLALEAADLPVLSTGRWVPTPATDDDLTATRTSQAESGATLTIECEAAADDSGI